MQKVFANQKLIHIEHMYISPTLEYDPGSREHIFIRCDKYRIASIFICTLFTNCCMFTTIMRFDSFSYDPVLKNFILWMLLIFILSSRLS